MNTIRYSLKHVFARDMALKMNYGSSFDLVKLKKVTVEYTSKYLLEDPKHSFLAFVALKLVTNQTPKMTFAQKSVSLQFFMTLLLISDYSSDHLQ